MGKFSQIIKESIKKTAKGLGKSLVDVAKEQYRKQLIIQAIGEKEYLKLQAAKRLGYVSDEDIKKYIRKRVLRERRSSRKRRKKKEISIIVKPQRRKYKLSLI